jgi:hypothetical protein
MPCGYPDNKELMGLLLQKFEILHKVELLIPPSLPSGYSHRLLHSVLKKEAKMGFVRVYTKPQLCGVGHALQDEVAVYFSSDILSNFLKI